jgi:tol-pal system protein YbgF
MVKIGYSDIIFLTGYKNMKKFGINIIFILAIVPFLAQCASQSDVEELRYQLRIVNKKLEDMKSTTVPLQKRQAAASGQMDQFEKEILELKGQLDETHHVNQRLKDQNKELETSISNVAQEEAAKREEALRRFEESLREKEAKLSEKMNQQQESVKAIQEARLKEAERKAKETALMAELAKKKTQTANAPAQPESDKSKQASADKKKEKKDSSLPSGTSDPAETVTKQTTASTAKEKPTQPGVKEKPNQPAVQEKAAQPSESPGPTGEQSDNNMKKAQKLFEKNSYAEALPLFEQVAGNSSSNESVEARYMMGECLFNQKEYDKAIMQYQKIISQYSGHDKAPSAMLKQGMAFEKLADKETAKVIYKKLLKKHGSSSEASKAQERLGKL